MPDGWVVLLAVIVIAMAGMIDGWRIVNGTWYTMTDGCSTVVYTAGLSLG